MATGLDIEGLFNGFVGSMTIPVRWSPQERESQVRVSLEPSGSGVVIVYDRALADAAVPDECQDFVLADYRVLLEASDGALSAELQGSLISTDSGRMPGYRFLSFLDCNVTARSNLELSYPKGPAPAVLVLDFTWLRFDSGFADRLGLSIGLRRDPSAGQPSALEYDDDLWAALGTPLDGCAAFSPPFEGTCVPLSRHPALAPQDAGAAVGEALDASPSE